MSHTAERIAEVQGRIALAAEASGRKPDSVRLIAVAKTATRETLLEAWEYGHRLFGHNRIQALSEHAATLPRAEWHILGPLQRNKAAAALRLATCIQTVSSLRILERLQFLLSKAASPPFPVLLQVNLNPEDGRAGCSETEIPSLLEALKDSPKIKCNGLMTLGPYGASDSLLHAHFARLRLVGEELAKKGQLPSAFELSMGMTEDYSIAVEEGATLVRVGRAIFPG